MDESPGPHHSEIRVHNPARLGGVGLKRLVPWLRSLTVELAPAGGSLGVLLASNRRMRELNRIHRGRDAPTDVLSFPGGETPEGSHLGDIVVAVPIARRQAAAAGHSLARELQMLILHGLLHCLGYDHESDDGTMAALERRLRREWIDAP